MDKSQEPENKPTGLGIMHIINSVLAAMFGVCSNQRYEKDFEEGDLAQFMAIGVVLVVLFVLSLIAIVKGILA